MQIFYVFYFTLVTYLLAMTMPESQGRWPTLYEDVLSLISYTHWTTSAVLFPYHFVIVMNSVSVENLFSSMGEIDVCWLSPFGTDGTCHPLDIPIAPTPTLILDTPATLTVPAIATSPTAFNLISHKDMFPVQLETKYMPGKSKEFKSTQGGAPNDAESPHLLDLLTAAASTMVIIQLLMVLGQPVVRYLESFNQTTFVPNGLEFDTPADFPDSRHSLILSWIPTRPLIPIDSITYVQSDDEASLKELSLWVLYFAMVLVRSCSEPAPPPPTTKTRTIRKYPLMIEAPVSGEVVEEVLSFCWFQPHTLLASSSELGEGLKVEPVEPKDKLNSLQLKPAAHSQAPDVVHSPTPPTTDSLHLADYIDKPGPEVTRLNQPKSPAPTFPPETSSMMTELSHPHLSPDVSEPTLVQSFEKISGRRTTPPVQLAYGQVDGTSKIRPSLSLLKVISMESLPLGEYDIGLLSQSTAPSKKVSIRPLSLLGKASPFSRPSPSPTPDSIRSPEVRPMRLLRMYGLYNSPSKSPRTTVDLASSAHKVKQGSSIYYRPASQTSLTSPPVVTGPGDPVSGPPLRSYTDAATEEGSSVSTVRLSIPSVPSRWSLLTKKSKQKLRKVSSSFFASSNSPSSLREKVKIFPRSLSRRAFDNSGTA
ncbi:hypothetical protein BDM02DRAFT_3190374 [Thelephora ganbajun]|uniref:Uncharacterized protein n=1 Tax=Thelephora ganbajun TaxID=370292 RepID=A0ACB6Z4Y4_THEGA|nr:hypothetical protein BDM02DRAFT_3190374 [Thelephora ganbajun]